MVTAISGSMTFHCKKDETILWKELPVINELPIFAIIVIYVCIFVFNFMYASYKQ